MIQEVSVESTQGSSAPASSTLEPAEPEPAEQEPAEMHDDFWYAEYGAEGGDDAYDWYGDEW